MGSIPRLLACTIFWYVALGVIAIPFALLGSLSEGYVISTTSFIVNYTIFFLFGLGAWMYFYLLDPCRSDEDMDPCGNDNIKPREPQDYL